MHPKLQAKLGELFFESIKTFPKRQFIIETHSEHLLLKIQKLIRDNILSPENVSIIYIEKTKEGSHVIPLELNTNGYFIDGWPEGFFDNNLNDILG